MENASIKKYRIDTETNNNMIVYEYGNEMLCFLKNGVLNVNIDFIDFSIPDYYGIWSQMLSGEYSEIWRKMADIFNVTPEMKTRAFAKTMVDAVI